MIIHCLDEIMKAKPQPHTRTRPPSTQQQHHFGDERYPLSNNKRQELRNAHPHVFLDIRQHNYRPCQQQGLGAYRKPLISSIAHDDDQPTRLQLNHYNKHKGPHSFNHNSIRFSTFPASPTIHLRPVSSLDVMVVRMTDATLSIAFL